MFRSLIVLMASSLISSASYGNPIAASQLKERILDTLKEKHSLHEGETWFESRGSFDADWLIAAPFQSYSDSSQALPEKVACLPSETNCHPQFERKLCSTDLDCGSGLSCQPLNASINPLSTSATNMCLAPADQLLERVYDVITSAENTLDITSLSAPTGRFREAMINGLARLSRGANVPSVRLLFSSLDGVKPNFLNPPEKILAGIVADIDRRGGNSQRLPINLAWLSTPVLSWNHSKIIIADQIRVLNGGHNLWDADYLSEKPVFDVSMEGTGDLARKTLDFVKLLWSKTRKFAANPSDLGSIQFDSLESSLHGDTPVIGIGRMGALGNNAADDAIISMIDNAEDSLYMSQQDLFNRLSFTPQPSWALDHLIAAAKRGVKVRLVQSNKGQLLGYGMMSPAESMKEILKRSITLSKNFGSSDYETLNDAYIVCEQMELAPFRFRAEQSTWDDGSSIGNHSKMIIVDEAAFYIGSQNFYPANLQEHGYVIPDSALTEQLLDQYWQPLWLASSSAKVDCHQILGQM